MRPSACVLSILAALAPVAAPAGEVVVGLGYADFPDRVAPDAALVEVELHSRPIGRLAGATWSIGGVLEHRTEGEVFVGVGPAGTWPVGGRWFVEASVMPGYFGDRGIAEAFGGNFQIRSLLGAGVAVSDRLSVSLAVSHMSNANTARPNPGANALSFRTRWRF